MWNEREGGAVSQIVFNGFIQILILYPNKNEYFYIKTKKKKKRNKN